MMAGIVSLRTRDLVCGATISKLYIFALFVRYGALEGECLSSSLEHARTHCGPLSDERIYQLDRITSRRSRSNDRR